MHIAGGFDPCIGDPPLLEIPHFKFESVRVSKIQWKCTEFVIIAPLKKISIAILIDSVNFHWISETVTDSNLECGECSVRKNATGSSVKSFTEIQRYKESRKMLIYVLDDHWSWA